MAETSVPRPRVDPAVLAEMRERLPAVADDVVAAIIADVPTYGQALSGPMGETIRNAVQLALGGFISLASGRRRGHDARTPTGPAVEGAYQLGRGEARSGRSMEALLAAYRIGARVSWREMAATAVAAGTDAEQLADFAELVFAYIDELSAASVTGHSEELTTSGRVQARLRERLAHLLLVGAPADDVDAAAERAQWEPPRTLTAVLVPGSQARAVLAAVDPATLQAAAEDVPGSTGLADEPALLLVPDVHGRRRARLLEVLDRLPVRPGDAVAGPARAWRAVRSSYDRAARAAALRLGPDTEAHLPELVLTADPAALADLRERVLGPLADLRPAARDKLLDTLRSWLLHQGRRDDVAAALFVHPQTVRYRMGQLREAYGDRLDDPAWTLALTLALGVSPGAPAAAPAPRGGRG